MRNASVTFATVVVRFSCLRFSLRFFRHRRRHYATTFAFTLLTITLRFLSATTRTKPNIDLADIVRQPQGHRTVIVLSSRQPHINRTMPTRWPCGSRKVSVRWQTSWQARPTVLVLWYSWGQPIYHLTEHGWLDSEEGLEVSRDSRISSCIRVS